MVTDGTRNEGDDGTELDGERPPAEPAELRAIVETYDDAPDQCTIYPAESSPHERMATWITAAEPAFVDLEDAR